MATRCLGRVRLTGAAAVPLLFSLRRAVDFPAALPAGDFFCAAFLVAARDAGLFDFFLAMMPSLMLRPNWSIRQPAETIRRWTRQQSQSERNRYPLRQRTV